MIEPYLEEARALADALAKNQGFSEKFEKAVAAAVAAFRSGKKVLAAGNGGSAADAQHFAAEFMGKYKLSRKAYPAIALTTDTSFLTAWSNDASFDSLFERQIEGLGRKGDVFFGISTSGNSENILKAFTAAKRAHMVTIALLGGDGGKAKGMADVEFIVPSRNTPRVQELHMFILHSIAEDAEKTLT